MFGMFALLKLNSFRLEVVLRGPRKQHHIAQQDGPHAGCCGEVFDDVFVVGKRRVKVCQ